MRNTGWSKVLLTGYDQQSLRSNEILSNRGEEVPAQRGYCEGRQSTRLHTRGRNVSGRWTGIHNSYTRFYTTQPFLEDGWKKRGTIPEEFVTFQKKCVN